MHSVNRMFVRSTLGLAFVTLASSFAAGATITVSPTVTGSAGSFLYAYTITNNTPDDPFVIDIPVLKSVNAVTNLTAPAGFKATFDSGLGLVAFLEDTAFFTSTPVSGFSFRSPFGPSAVLFQATTLSSSNGNVFNISGPTQSPIPEPGYLGLVALSLFAGFFTRLKRSGLFSQFLQRSN